MENNAITADIGGNFTPCPPGNHVAHCFGIIVAGTYMESFKGSALAPKKKIYIGFEITSQRHIFKEGEPERPFTIWVEYLQSLTSTSNLRKMIENWAGEKYTDEQIKDLDLRDLIGKSCLAVVVHRTSSAGKLRNEIMSISQVPQGTTVPAMFNKSLVFNYTNPFDSASFDLIPGYIQTKMKETPEYKAALGAGITPNTPPPATEVKKKLF